MPRIGTGANQSASEEHRTRRKRKRRPAAPAPAPRPAPVRQTTTQERARPPAFRPIQSQNRPLEVQQTRAKRKVRKTEKRLGDPRYASAPDPTPPPFKIDPVQIGRSPAFRPVGSQSRPQRVQQSQQRQKTRQARNKLPDHPDIPDVPLGLYTQDQIGEIRDAYKKAAKKLGGSSINDLYQYGSLSQRRKMRKVGRIISAIEEERSSEVASIRGVEIGRDRIGINDPRVKAAGIPVGELLHDVGRGLDSATRIPNKRDASVADLLNIPVQLTRATVEDPKAVAKSSLRTAYESVAGIPQGVKEFIDDPEEAAKKTVEDYERRYGPIFNDPARFREQVKTESGLTPFVFDAASLGAPVGRVATVIARSGPAGRAVVAVSQVVGKDGRMRPLADFLETTHKTARAPRDARRAANLRAELERAINSGDAVAEKRLRAELKHAEANEQATERAALRFSGGEGGVKKQDSSPNLIVGLGQRGLDASRRRAAERAATGAGLDQGPGGRLLTVRGRKVKRMTALRPGENEVVPKTTGVVGRSVRELPGLRRYTGRVARDLGGEQSMSRTRLLTHRGRLHNQINKALSPLDDRERSSLKYMLQLGATPDGAGIRILEGRRRQIEENRAGRGTKIAPLLADTNDELALINQILEDPSAHLTPHARQVASDLRDLQVKEAKLDPELDPEQELIRRMTPQGKALGLDRAPDAEFFRQVLGGIERDTDMPGVARFADELADMAPAARGARAKELLRMVSKDRKAAERNVETDRRRLAVANATVRTTEERGRPLETAEVRAARGELAAAKRARSRIGRSIPRSERRSGALLGRLGEREAHGRALNTPDVREARAAVSEAQSRVSSLEGQLRRAERRAGRRIGEATNRETRSRNMRALGAELNASQLEQDLASARAELKAAQTHLADVEGAAPRLTGTQLLNAADVEAGAASRFDQLALAEQRVQAARDALNGTLAAAPRATDAQRNRVEVHDRTLAASRATREHITKFENALKEVVRASKDKSTMRLEDAETFASRVRQAADEFGLEAPAYWWSSLMPKEMASLAAAGRGTRAAHANKKYKGTLFDVGAEETSVDVFTRGVDRNVKRRFQQALVVRNLETHAYEWSRGKGGKGMTIKQLEKEFLKRQIDPRSVELIDPRVLRRRTADPEGVDRGRVYDEDEFDSIGDDPVSTTQQNLAAARRTVKDVQNDELARQSQFRYLAVPREVGETLDGVANRMDNAFWRGWEVVTKQKPARILLGAANVPWLAFQIASNALLTGFGGGLNPWNIHGAHKWFKGLEPGERDAIEAELGITHGHHFGMDQPNLGAVNSRMVNYWRAYKKSHVGRLGTKVNPLNAMFRVDEAQNNLFRKVLFYDKARKTAYRRMGASWTGFDKAATRAIDRVLARPPEHQAALIAKHGKDFEDAAAHVNSFLGDYLKFTPAERFALQRNIMFYGYLRFSLRFAFYTMPIAHPIMTNILGNVGRLGADEIKKLMGVPDNYTLPTSILAATYFGDEKDAEKGELRSLALNRFNPFMNTLTQLDGLQQAVGLVSPLYQMVVDQAFEESSFTGRDWRIGGRPTPAESQRPRNYYGSAAGLLNPADYSWPGHEGNPRNRILQAGLLGLAFPARVAEQTGIPGVMEPLEPNQSDDALPWLPQPMQYADPEARKGVNKSRREARKEGGAEKLGKALLPVFPKRNSARQVVERELEREESIRERNKRKPGAARKRRKKKANRYGGGAGGGSRYRG